MIDVFRKSMSIFRPRGFSSIYKRLLAYFIVFALIPTAIFTIFFYSSYSKYINETITKLGDEILGKATASLNYYFESIIRVGDIAADNQRIQEALRTDFKGDIALEYKTDLSMDAELYFTNYLQPEIAGLSILGENGGEYKSNDRAFISEDHTKRDWYKQIKSDSGYTWFPPHRMQYANVSDIYNESFISCGKPIVNSATGMINGVLLIDIHEEVIRKIISTDLGGMGYILILDKNNNVIVSSSSEKGTISGNGKSDILKDKPFSTKLKIIRDGESSNQRVVVTSNRLLENGWRIVGFIPVQQLNRQGITLIILTVVIALMIVIFAIFSAFRVSGSVLKPITKLRKDMKEVESGNFDIVTATDSNYIEVTQLSNSFSLMVNRIKELMDNTYRDQRKLRKAELEALQSNINPHFLYNTMDSILWLNRADRKGDIETIVESLTNFFRIGLSRGRAIITLEEEVKHLESYLNIQAIRYGNKFDYTNTLDDEVRHFKIPKLILQPLAENAIYHGIKPKGEYCQINTTISKVDDFIQIKMHDTGIGINDEDLILINDAMRGNDNSNFQIYGTKNIRDRLRILFGEEASIIFSSSYYEWTEVTIMIPDIILEDQE